MTSTEVGSTVNTNTPLLPTAPTTPNVTQNHLSQLTMVDENTLTHISQFLTLRDTSHLSLTCKTINANQWLFWAPIMNARNHAFDQGKKSIATVNSTDRKLSLLNHLTKVNSNGDLSDDLRTFTIEIHSLVTHSDPTTESFSTKAQVIKHYLNENKIVQAQSRFLSLFQTSQENRLERQIHVPSFINLLTDLYIAFSKKEQTEWYVDSLQNHPTPSHRWKSEIALNLVKNLVNRNLEDLAATLFKRTLEDHLNLNFEKFLFSTKVSLAIDEIRVNERGKQYKNLENSIERLLMHHSIDELDGGLAHDFTWALLTLLDQGRCDGKFFQWILELPDAALPQKEYLLSRLAKNHAIHATPLGVTTILNKMGNPLLKAEALQALYYTLTRRGDTPLAEEDTLNKIHEQTSAMREHIKNRAGYSIRQNYLFSEYHLEGIEGRSIALENRYQRYHPVITFMRGRPKADGICLEATRILSDNNQIGEAITFANAAPSFSVQRKAIDVIIEKLGTNTNPQEVLKHFNAISWKNIIGLPKHNRVDYFYKLIRSSLAADNHSLLHSIREMKTDTLGERSLKSEYLKFFVLDMINREQFIMALDLISEQPHLIIRLATLSVAIEAMEKAIQLEAVDKKVLVQIKGAVATAEVLNESAAKIVESTVFLFKAYQARQYRIGLIHSSLARHFSSL